MDNKNFGNIPVALVAILIIQIWVNVSASNLETTAYLCSEKQAVGFTSTNNGWAQRTFAADSQYFIRRLTENDNYTLPKSTSADKITHGVFNVDSEIINRPTYTCEKYNSDGLICSEGRQKSMLFKFSNSSLQFSFTYTGDYNLTLSNNIYMVIGDCSPL